MDAQGGSAWAASRALDFAGCAAATLSVGPTCGANRIDKTKQAVTDMRALAAARSIAFPFNCHVEPIHGAAIVEACIPSRSSEFEDLSRLEMLSQVEGQIEMQSLKLRLKRVPLILCYGAHASRASDIS